MSLTKAMEIQLTNPRFTDAFKDHRDLWVAMAKQAYEYTRETVGEDDPRRDDAAPHLETALKASPEFVKLKGQKKARGDYWFRYFADLIIDRSWTEFVPKEKRNAS